MKATASDPIAKSEVIFRQALSHYQSDRLVKALEGFDAVIALRPNAPMAYFHRGLTLFGLKKFQEAAASYNRAIALKPEYAEAHSNLGNVLQELKRPKDAIISYDRAIAIKPDFASAYNNRGFALMKIGKMPDALASYDRAIELEPEYAQAHINRGSALTRMDRQHDALASYDRAIELQPDNAVIYFGKGLVLSELKRLDEALASFDRAIQLQPDYAEAYWGKSHVSLLLGDYEEGWKLDEWRFQGALYKSSGKQYQKPRWTDRFAATQQQLPKTLLVYAEAGQGDTIQYSRYIPMLKELGIEPVVEVQPSLFNLMSTLAPDIAVIEKSAHPPEFDQFIAVGSLPYAFGTTLETIPAKFPYLFADQKKQEEWRQKLGEKTKPRIGIAWSGQVNRRIDTSSAKNRSIPLRHLEPILNLPFEFHSLQKEVRPDDEAILSKSGSVRDHRADLKDFADTAALVANLDLVISIDTSVAHLVGSLGKKLWVMLPFCTDYRWTMDGAVTPWYPNATLFRQPSPGDWKSVVAELKTRLGTFKQ